MPRQTSNYFNNLMLVAAKMVVLLKIFKKSYRHCEDCSL